MNAYNPAGREFWIEAYGGRPYRVERRKHGTEPVDVDRLVVAAFGGTQPDKLTKLLASGDDGLLARFLWAWPDPIAQHARGVSFPSSNSIGAFVLRIGEAGAARLPSTGCTPGWAGSQAANRVAAIYPAPRSGAPKEPEDS